ncbi:MAG: hypothetical protein MZU84_06355 [Sphingobacterium sp.]|nr:hypothetical protein [Sphingobacterium sp.]
MCPGIDSDILWACFSGKRTAGRPCWPSPCSRARRPLSAQDPAGPAVQDILALPRTERIVVRRVKPGRSPSTAVSDEPGWAGILPLCMVMQAPTFGEACSERSEALLGYDDEFVYVAGRLFDREPDKIQAPTRKRDAMIATHGLVRRPLRHVQRQGELPGLLHDPGRPAFRRRGLPGRPDAALRTRCP